MMGNNPTKNIDLTSFKSFCQSTSLDVGTIELSQDAYGLKKGTVLVAKFYDTITRYLQCENEIYFLKKMKGKGCPKYYDSFALTREINITENQPIPVGTYCILMEKIEGDDLYDHIDRVYGEINRMSEAIVKLYFKQIIDLVDGLHQMNIVHLDLKLENLMFTNDGIKIIDFESAMEFPLGNFKRDLLSFGTPGYSAPEIFKLKDTIKPEQPVSLTQLDETPDIYSLGQILYSFLTFNQPTNFEDSITNLCKREVSSEVIDLYKSMIKIDPKERATIEEIKQSKWMKSRRNTTV